MKRSWNVFALIVLIAAATGSHALISAANAAPAQSGRFQVATDTVTPTGTLPTATSTLPAATSTATSTATGTTATGTAATATTTAATGTATTTGTAATATTTAVTATSTVVPEDYVVTLSSGYRITFLGVTYNRNRSTWRYFVEELAGAPDLRDWALELRNCAVVRAQPDSWHIVRANARLGVDGIKWKLKHGGPDDEEDDRTRRVNDDDHSNFQSGEFSFTLVGEVPIGSARVAVRGDDVFLGSIAGPRCSRRAEDHEPPPVIVIRPPETAPEVVVINNVVFVNTVIVINNTGGDAHGVLLSVDLDDVLDLSDLQFLERTGYVVRIEGRRVVIGVGENNVVRHDHAIRIRLRFRVTQVNTTVVTTRISYTITFNGGHTTPVIIIINVPPISAVPTAGSATATAGTPEPSTTAATATAGTATATTTASTATATAGTATATTTASTATSTATAGTGTATTTASTATSTATAGIPPAGLPQIQLPSLP